MKATIKSAQVASFGLVLSLLIALASTSVAGSATWRLNPTSGDWNTAANWIPTTVPSAPEDTATFDTSMRTDVSLSEGVEISAITFNPAPSAYTITYDSTLILDGAGIVNNSGRTQTIVIGPIANPGLTFFNNSASAGDSTMFINYGSMDFNDASTASRATIINKGPSNLASGGSTGFFSSSNAGDATFLLEGGPVANGGSVMFNDGSSAANGVFIIEGVIANGAGGGNLSFFGNSLAGTGKFTIDGNNFTNTDQFRGFVAFLDNSAAENASLTANGSPVSGALGGLIEFAVTSTAGNASVTANGGLNGGLGGEIEFLDDARGGTSRIQVTGNADLDISGHNAPSVTIGSIEGNGNVFLGARNLKVGANGQSTIFSGVIADGGLNGGVGGSLTKVGKADLTLRGPDTYTGGTIINGGTLLVRNRKGSATGTGSVKVNIGTLSGTGTISGAVTVGNGTTAGAILQPGMGTKPGTLTINNTVSFSATSAFKWNINRVSPPVGATLNALGVTIGSNVTFTLVETGTAALTPGTVFTVINNTSANPISGTFSNLPDGGTITSGNGTVYKANYSGGTGNDLTLTVQ